MMRFRRGTPVVLLAPLERGRRRRHGPLPLRRGTKGRVVECHGGPFKEPKYDVEVPDGLFSVRLVRSVAAGKLRRRAPWALYRGLAGLVFAAVLWWALVGEYGG
jgi:hypothetical protein